jgi:hypothetical protein
VHQEPPCLCSQRNQRPPPPQAKPAPTVHLTALRLLVIVSVLKCKYAALATSVFHNNAIASARVQAMLQVMNIDVAVMLKWEFSRVSHGV